MKLHTIFAVMAAVEASAGAARAIAPGTTTSLLLGTELDAPAALVVLRMAGAALFSLGIVCWNARTDGASPAGRGVLAAMLFYNAAVAALLAYAGAGVRAAGPALWPAVALHAALTVWCGVCLRGPRP